MDTTECPQQEQVPQGRDHDPCDGMGAVIWMVMAFMAVVALVLVLSIVSM